MSLRKLDSCFAVAQRLTEISPGDDRGWTALARTLCLQGRVHEAYQLALAKAEEFPESWELLYEVACYACLLGKREEARRYLEAAKGVGNPAQIKLRALDDPDLDGLWGRER